MLKPLGAENIPGPDDIAMLIFLESKRLADKYNKSFLDCENLVEITGLGRDNVRVLMYSGAFPIIKVGNRKVVSIVSFVSWQLSSGGEYGKKE